MRAIEPLSRDGSVLAVPDVLIRGLSAHAYGYFKARAEASKRSLNAELREALEGGARPRRTMDEWMDLADDMRTRIAARWAEEGRTPPTSAELIRKNREES